MTKAELVKKIASEQNLDPEKLMRMNMNELKKMDQVVPDNKQGDAGSAPSSSEIDSAFGNTLEQDEDSSESEEEKKPEEQKIDEPVTLKVPVAVELEIPVTFKVEESVEDIELNTPGKYRKFISKKDSK